MLMSRSSVKLTIKIVIIVWNKQLSLQNLVINELSLPCGVLTRFSAIHEIQLLTVLCALNNVACLHKM